MCNILQRCKIKYGAIKGNLLLTISDVLPSFLECQEPLHHGGFRVYGTLQIRVIRQNFNVAGIRFYLYKWNKVKKNFFFKPFHTNLHFVCFYTLYTVNLQWYKLLNTLFGFAREDYPIVCSDSFDIFFIEKQCLSIFYSSLQTAYDSSKYNINWFRCLDLYQYYHITHSKVCLSYTKSFWKFLCLCWSLWTCTTSH